jgi:predicted nucleic acid-binding protein
MAAVVADASPLIALHQIEQLGLLEGLFGQVVIPPAVAGEVAPSLPTLPAWIHVRELTQPVNARITRAGLGQGESEALGLALQIEADLVIVDDRPARRLAVELGCSVAGTAGVLVMAKRAGLITAVRPHIDRLLTFDFRIAPAIVEEVLAQAGEHQA